jgi:hypothetical protein
MPLVRHGYATGYATGPPPAVQLVGRKWEDHSVLTAANLFAL